MIRLNYIFHDCFFLETDSLGVVFDFWKDPRSDDEESPLFLKDFPESKPLYVLVSHFHKDHLNKCVFGWRKHHPNIHYIVSKDVRRHVRYLLDADSSYAGERVPEKAISVVSKGDVFEDSLIEVRAFGSTDIGNSYALIIKEGRLKVFHAGDLNCWTWRDESTEEEILRAEKGFLTELQPILQFTDNFDIAMFPVDSRIGTGYEEGAKIFLDKFSVKRFFPMHFTLGDTEEERARLLKDAVDFDRYRADRGEYIALTAPGDSYEFFADYSEKVSNKIFERQYFLSAGDCNAEKEMALTVLTSKLIDSATMHANSLGIGNPNMPDNHSGWVLSRLTIEMSEYPAIDSDYRISTWVESWNKHFSERSFKISSPDGKVYGFARSIWMVLDTYTHANAGLDSLPFREDYISDEICPIKRQAKHRLIMLENEEGAESPRVLKASSPIVLHKFLYSDLDAYRHVNTVRYVALLMSQFSLSQHDENRVARIELSFLDEGEYGKEIEILRNNPEDEHALENSTSFLLRKADNKEAILYSRVFFSKR